MKALAARRRHPLAGIVLHRFFLVGEPPTQDLVVNVIDQIILPAAKAAGRP